LERRTDVVHLSGSTNWRPKRLCQLTEHEFTALREAGFRVEDFRPRLFPAFGLIPDRFSVGFKLKLMQMVYCSDVIASLCDLSEEIQAIYPNYPFYKFVSSVSDAINFFETVRNEKSAKEIDTAFAGRRPKDLLPTWEDLASQVSKLVR
jgi:hypothetical protein